MSKKNSLSVVFLRR